jgi:amidase
VYQNVIAELRAAGATMTQGWPEGIDPGPQLQTYLFLLLAFFEKETADASVAKPHGRWLRETQKRLGFRALWQKYFESHDVFLLPAGFSAAFPHDHSEPLERRVIETSEGKQPYLNTPLWTTFATLAGLPATVAPVGRTNAGLPVGIQIIAPMWEDGTGIEFAGLLAEAVGGPGNPDEFRE